MPPERPRFPAGLVPTLPRMLITTRFALVHVPRTGGNFIRDLCFEHLPQEWLVRNALDIHTPYADIAEDFADVPMICFVRNPWDWYVSWYHHQTQHYDEPRSGPLWTSAFESGRASFRDVVERCCTGEHYESPTTEPILRALGVDHYTARFVEVTRPGIDEGRLEVGRYERLREDFLAFLERHEIPLEAQFEALLAEAPGRHASERGPYRSYYDDELRELVRDRARLIVDGYGYEF